MRTSPVPRTPLASPTSGIDAIPEAVASDAFQTAFEEAGIGMAIVDLGGHPVTTNRRFQKFLGYSGPELQAMNFLEFTHPDDAQADWSLFQELLSGTRDHFQIDKRYVHKDGATVTGRLTASAMRETDGSPRYVVAILEEVSESKEAEAALAEAEHRYRTLTEQIPAVTYIVPLDGKLAPYSYISPQVEGLLGYSPDQWLSEPDLWERILHPEDAERAIRESDQAEEDREPYVSEYRLLAKDGSVVCFEDRATLIRGPKDHAMIWHGVMFDVTARKEAETQVRDTLDDLRRSQAQQRKLAARLLHAQESERQQIAKDLHDDPIQTLTAVQIRLATIKGGVSDEAAVGLQVIEKSLSATIGRLRSLMFDLRPPVLDREGLAAAVRDAGSRIAQEADWDFRVDDDLRGAPPAELAAAAYRIVKEALINVRKHTEAQQVRVALSFDGDTLSGTIRDDGLGFDPQSLPSEPEDHVGLASILERAEFFGGGIDIKSEVGHGTTVRFWLPQSPAIERDRAGAG